MEQKGLTKLDKALGCVPLLLIAIFFMCMAGGSMMGDYIGPPEGAEANKRAKETRILISLAVLVGCGVAGAWIVSQPTKSEPNNEA